MRKDPLKLYYFIGALLIEIMVFKEDLYWIASVLGKELMEIFSRSIVWDLVWIKDIR